jgi:hypothetical protein
MIAELIEILQSGNFYGVSKEIEIAKGKHEKVYTFKDMKTKIVRQWRSRKL